MAIGDGGTYLAWAGNGKAPGVIVLHPWWGLTPGVRAICDRLAQEGFHAAAPDLFGGKIARTPTEARRLRRAPRPQPMWRTLRAAMDGLLADPRTRGDRVGVIGLSMGGHWALWFASRPDSPLAAVVVFYAARAARFERGPDVPFQFHFAEDDAFVSAAARRATLRALDAAQRCHVEFDYAATQHWFFESDRPEYAARKSGLAWQRTLAFLRAVLTPARRTPRRPAR